MSLVILEEVCKQATPHPYMNLTIDIGNSRIKLGIFKNGQIVEKLVWESLRLEDLIQLTTNQKVENIIFSNVGKHLPQEVLDFLGTQFRLYELSTRTPLPIQNAYQTPETLGKDRIAAIVGAFELYPNKHCLVIDAGTCITYDLLRADGVFLGGNIAPGLDMRLKAMHTFTAKLPLVERALAQTNIGYDTKSALQIGACKGMLLEIEGFIQLLSSEWGEINVILTGGDADFFVKNLKSQIFVNPNLVLYGLNKILNYNVQLSE